MEPRCETLFDSLRAEAINLHLRWKIFRALYWGPPDVTVLLNNSGANVFHLFQSLLIDDCVLRLCKLTDRTSNGYQYASVPHLLALIHVDEADFVDSLTPTLNRLNEACVGLRTIRNTRIAHADLSMVMTLSDDSHAMPFREVSEALRLLAQVLNEFEVRFRRSRTFYGDVLIPQSADADQLISLLRIAHRAGA